MENDFNPVDSMMATMNQYGAQVELKKRMPDGTYQTASKETIDALGAQARIAATAEALQSLSHEERNSWALNKKNEANLMYSMKMYHEAIELYMEAITATDFGGEKNQGNVDEVVIPILCNLAACCIQTKVFWRYI
jgi:hypothetical protein